MGVYTIQAPERKSERMRGNKRESEMVRVEGKGQHKRDKKKKKKRNISGIRESKSKREGKMERSLKIQFIFAGRVSDVLPVYVSGPNGDAKNLNCIEQYWEILFNDEMINIIVQHTNNKIEEVCLKLVAADKAGSYHHLTDSDEIRAYIGILYYQGLWKSADVDNNRLWDKKTALRSTDVFSQGRDFYF